MFLQKVYRHNRWLFSAIVLFIIAQLFINLKRGLVVSPFYHYGMYSEVIDVKSRYNVFEVQVNGERLEAKKFSPQEWDKIILPLQYYTSINTKSNALYHTDIKRLLNKMHIPTKTKHFIQKCNYEEFERWYHSYLETMLKKKINSLHILSRVYSFSSGHLNPTDTTLSLSQVCN